MSKVLKIKQVKVYQSVKFEGAEYTFFAPAEYFSTRTSKPLFTLEETDGGCVIVKSEKDMIKIGSNNVAFIQYDISKDAGKPDEEKGLLKKAK